MVQWVGLVFLACQGAWVPSLVGKVRSRVTWYSQKTKELNRYFSFKEYIQMANKHTKRCVSLVIRKNVNQNHMRYHFTPTKTAEIEKIDNMLART